ncbi:MAG: beta-lactamase family protein [Caldilineaceae bacterium]|nr:beta-lactamase family protein [Caldilineaceae bacterium]
MTFDPQFADLITGAMQQYHTPGVAVGVLHNGKETCAGFGVTNLDHPLPVTAQTLFQIGSITKTFVATAAMRLVEVGKLDLDAPVRSYLPSFRLQDETAMQHATLRHCFTHTGGWLGDYFDDLSAGDDAQARYVTAMADLPQVTPLGKIWSYNNAGFAVVGRVIEVVTGQTFEDAVTALVLKPLGMEMTFFFADDVMTHRFVAGHLVVDQDDPAKTHAEVARPWALARTAHSAGGIVSCVEDMLRYARFHLGDGVNADGERLLLPASMSLMHCELVTAGSGTKATGIAWMINEAGGLKTIGHGGATRGQMANLLIVPERDFAVIVLTNSSLGSSTYRDVTQGALSHFLGIESSEPSVQSLDAESLAQYAGRYEAKLNHVVLNVDCDGLRAQLIPQGGFPKKDTPAPPSPPPLSLAFYGADKVIVTDGAGKGSKGEFLRGQGDEIVWFRFGGRVHRRVQ